MRKSENRGRTNIALIAGALLGTAVLVVVMVMTDENLKAKLKTQVESAVETTKGLAEAYKGLADNAILTKREREDAEKETKAQWATIEKRRQEILSKL